MKTLFAAAAALAVTAATAQAATLDGSAPHKIYSARFDPRPVDQVEIGDFHFIPGQPAPVHTHRAPVFGYVSQGAIYYQVAGQEAVILKAGDAFYEPVGPDILHFDNASKTEPAVFTDINLEQSGEPFIVFPTPPTARIDRRALPTTKLAVASVNRVDVYAQTLAPGRHAAAEKPKLPVFGYVAKGRVSFQLAGGARQTLAAGQTFAEPAGVRVERLANASGAEPAEIVTFHLIDDAH